MDLYIISVSKGSVGRAVHAVPWDVPAGIVVTDCSKCARTVVFGHVSKGNLERES